ncbi:hypothetical protein [Aeromonas salmonicida]|uniref:hypothetical protein n=1 Tax=Aeromonas salmonicida TaxID=645 RepID=UPI00138F4F7A|nr:hypothetical protein [Aeromonas salmonicida]
MKRFTHDADLRGMVVLRSLGFQLVPFKLHRFRKQRLTPTMTISNAMNWPSRVALIFMKDPFSLAGVDEPVLYRLGCDWQPLNRTGHSPVDRFSLFRQ